MSLPTQIRRIDFESIRKVHFAPQLKPFGTDIAIKLVFATYRFGHFPSEYVLVQMETPLQMLSKSFAFY